MKGKREKEKGKGGTKKIIALLVVLIVIAGGVLAFKMIQDKPEEETVAEEKSEEVTEAKVEEKKVQIYQGDDRPIAVMIDNHSDAWPQAGLQKAYMIYEIIVEGSETRLMALFKGVDVEKIGPVRSARHYFLDYSMENDAIYTHFGQSPQAESDLATYRINDINGIVEDGTTFWRVKDKSAPHNAVTSTKKLLESANKKKYRMTSTAKSVLNYSADEIDLQEAQKATTVTVPHSQLQTVKYVYDEKAKVYKRFARGKEQKDWDSKDTITTKNIIITFCDNYTLADSENKGRQGLKNIGTFDGYYITNGNAIKIKCIKKDRDEQTIYQDLQGNEIKVNDGNTFVNICPVSAKVIIEGEGESE